MPCLRKSPLHFTDLGSRSAVDLALHRREKEGPRPRPPFRLANPTRRSNPSESARTLIPGPRSSRLSSDGPKRSYSVGQTLVASEHTALKEAGFKLRESGLIVQDLKEVGQDRISPKVIAQVRRQFSPALRKRILLDTKTATEWIYAAIQRIAKENKLARISAQDRR